MVKALGHTWDDDAGNGKLSSSGDNGSLTVASGGAALLADDLRLGTYTLTFELDGNDLPVGTALNVGFSGNALKTNAAATAFVLAPSQTEVELPKAYVKRTVVFDVKEKTISIELQGAAGNKLASDTSPRTNENSVQLGVSFLNAGEKILVVSAFEYKPVAAPQPKPPTPKPEPRPDKPPKPTEQASYKGFSSSALAWAQDQERLLWDL